MVCIIFYGGTLGEDNKGNRDHYDSHALSSCSNYWILDKERIDEIPEIASYIKKMQDFGDSADAKISVVKSSSGVLILSLCFEYKFNISSNTLSIRVFHLVTIRNARILKTG